MTPGRTISDDRSQPKSRRACQACRASKVRCRKPHEDQPCTRCSEIGRHCAPREKSNKRQKRIDGRPVQNGEAGLDTVTEALQNGNSKTPPIRTTAAERTTTLDPQPATASLDTNRTGEFSSTLSDEYRNAHIEQSIRDVIDDETTSMIFSHFVENMLQHFPFMAFHPSATAEEILQTTPILLLAILDAAGDGFYATEVSRKLRKLLVKVYSTWLLETNSYSASLLQALVISVTWHRDMEGEPMDVFQLSNAAANLAMVMGMGKRPSDVEARRLWLACYYTCARYICCSRVAITVC
jgi:hypothetical protein